MSDQKKPDHSDDLPPCPVCGNDKTPCEVYKHCSMIFPESYEAEVCECAICHSIIPTEALKKWDEERRRSVDERLQTAADLLSESARPFDAACDILRRLLVNK